MTSPRRRLSRRELGLVAAALLVPLPIFAATGLSAPLPNAIERALGGLVVIDAQDERTGSSATVNASEEGNGTRRSANGSLAITRPRAGRAGRSLPPSGLSGLITSSTDQDGTGGDANTQPQQEASPDENGGGTGSPDQPAEPGGPGEPGPADHSTAVDKPADRTTPNAQIGVDGQGTGGTVSVGPGGVSVDNGADSDGAGSDDEGTVGASLNQPDGSSSGGNVTVPGLGVPTP